ncbi:MAG: HAD-IIB family hydrolase [Erysipelotrichaceae bacterium]|nr:HAD-IIB family hydrolase [Erysipelotrichaceae bacterium]
MIRMFATDIDHTLYCEELGRIPEENISAMKELVDRGVIIALASSRSYTGIIEVADMFDLWNHNGYAIVHNGAYVVRLSDGKVLASESFSEEEIRYFHDMAKQLGVGFSAMQDNFIYATNYSRIVDYDFQNVDMDVLISKKILNFIKGDVCQLEFFDDDKDMYSFINTIPEKDRLAYNFNVPQRPVMDISLRHVNKYWGLQQAMKDAGIAADELAATGDNDNDIEMMQAALISGCVANGSVNARKAATWVLKSDGEAGVAQFINEHLIGEHYV